MDIFAAAQTRQHRPEYTDRAWIAAEAERRGWDVEYFTDEGVSGKVVGSENEVEFKPADSLFVPAGSGKIKINGHCTVVKTTV